MAGLKRRTSLGETGKQESIETLAKRLKEEEDLLVDGVYLDEESTTQITRLFKIIDTNSDGCVDISDFTLNGVLTGPLVEKWREVRDKFDYDGDGQVTMEEFRRGFKKMVLKLGCQMTALPQDSSIEGYIRALERHVNVQIQELCKSAYLWYER